MSLVQVCETDSNPAWEEKFEFQLSAHATTLSFEVVDAETYSDVHLGASGPHQPPPRTIRRPPHGDAHAHSLRLTRRGAGR